MSNSNDITMTGKAALEIVSFTLESKFKDIFGQLSEDIKDCRDQHARNRLDLLLTLSSCQKVVQNAANVIDNNGEPLYLCSSWFLRDCLAHFSTTANESMLFVSGFELANLRSLSKFSMTRYSEQSRIFVAADDESYRKILTEMTDNGHRLLAWFHSHPGSGASSVNPSCVDMSHQRDLESGGYKTIGAIFARDGHVKFFSHSSSFQIEVLGKGVKKIDEKLFRINSKN